MKYVLDWTNWTTADKVDRPALFANILGKWQATRPKALRRVRARRDEHDPPYIEDLLESAAPHLTMLSGFFVGRARPLAPLERRSLAGLWAALSQLPQEGSASCVSITKATLLLTEGRVGPALDSKVRGQLHCGHIKTAEDWADVLSEVSGDIRAFEDANRSSLATVVPKRFAGLANGRLYDMALGPR